MPQVSMDYWTIGGVIIAGVALYIAWRQFRGGSKRVKQTMVDSVDGEQTVTSPDGGVEQEMKDSKGGKQNA